jgi:hypothetical protein
MGLAGTMMKDERTRTAMMDTTIEVLSISTPVNNASPLVRTGMGEHAYIY